MAGERPAPEYEGVERAIKVSPQEMRNIREAAKAPQGMVFTAAFVCWCRTVPIFFDATVKVRPTLKQMINRSNPGGVIILPKYIPEDAENITFTGIAQATGA